MEDLWQGKLKSNEFFFLFTMFSSYPVVFLLASLMSTLILGLGLISFREEHDLTKVRILASDWPKPVNTYL